MFSKGGKVEKFKVPGRNPYVQEHADLIAAIREGKTSTRRRTSPSRRCPTS